MLPSDRYLAELLGLTDEQFDYWRDEIRKRAAVCSYDGVFGLLFL